MSRWPQPIWTNDPGAAKSLSVGDVLLSGFALICAVPLLGLTLILVGVALEWIGVPRAANIYSQMYGYLLVVSTSVIWPGVIAGAICTMLAAKSGFGGWAPTALIGATCALLSLMPFQEFVQGLAGNGYPFLMVHGAIGSFVF